MCVRRFSRAWLSQGYAKYKATSFRIVRRGALRDRAATHSRSPDIALAIRHYSRGAWVLWALIRFGPVIWCGIQLDMQYWETNHSEPRKRNKETVGNIFSISK